MALCKSHFLARLHLKGYSHHLWLIFTIYIEGDSLIPVLSIRKSSSLSKRKSFSSESKWPSAPWSVGNEHSSQSRCNAPLFGVGSLSFGFGSYLVDELYICLLVVYSCLVPNEFHLLAKKQKKGLQRSSIQTVLCIFKPPQKSSFKCLLKLTWFNFTWQALSLLYEVWWR